MQREETGSHIPFMDSRHESRRAERGEEVGGVRDQKRRGLECPVGESSDIVEGRCEGGVAGKQEKQESCTAEVTSRSLVRAKRTQKKGCLGGKTQSNR